MGVQGGCSLDRMVMSRGRWGTERDGLGNSGWAAGGGVGWRRGVQGGRHGGCKDGGDGGRGRWGAERDGLGDSGWAADGGVGWRLGVQGGCCLDRMGRKM